MPGPNLSRDAKDVLLPCHQQISGLWQRTSPLPHPLPHSFAEARLNHKVLQASSWVNSALHVTPADRQTLPQLSAWLTTTTPRLHPLGRMDDMLEPTAATMAPAWDPLSTSSTNPCPTPPPSPAPCTIPPAVQLALEDGGSKVEEDGAQARQAGAESVCRVMGLLGMGHRLFVPKLLAVRADVVVSLYHVNSMFSVCLRKLAQYLFGKCWLLTVLVLIYNSL